MSDLELPEYAQRNRDHWELNNAKYTDGRAHESWAADEIAWGVWKVPESAVHGLPELEGRDVIELGCGTAYFGAWLKKRGARRVVGIDVSPAQLKTARRMEAEFNLGLEFIEGNAEAVPLADASFDVAFSEYGASIWCDAYKWIPEAARLLRPGGDLIFLRNSTLATLCSRDEGPVTETLAIPQSGLDRLDWHDDGEHTTEFHIPAGAMIRLLRKSGFEVLDLIDLYPTADSKDHPFYSYVSVDWGRRWPAEELWSARKK